MSNNQPDLNEFDKPSFVLNVVSFLCPLLGLIIYISLVGKLPRQAVKAGACATAGAVGWVGAYILLNMWAGAQYWTERDRINVIRGDQLAIDMRKWEIESLPDITNLNSAAPDSPFMTGVNGYPSGYVIFSNLKNEIGSVSDSASLGRLHAHVTAIMADFASNKILWKEEGTFYYYDLNIIATATGKSGSDISRSGEDLYGLYQKLERDKKDNASNRLK